MACYAAPWTCCYNSYGRFLSGSSWETYSYNCLRQLYSFSVLSGIVVLPSDLANMRSHTKVNKFPRPYFDFPIDQVLLAPLDTYSPLLSLVAISYLPTILSVQIHLIPV